MTVTDPYTGIGVITRGAFDSDMAAISLSLHSSCNDIALNEKNSPSFCQIHFYRGIFHLLSSCTLSTLRAFNSSSFHPSSPQIHPFSMIPVTPQFQSTHSLRSATPAGFSADPHVGVSIHALLAECDRAFVLPKPEFAVSIHALLAECDLHTGGNAGRRRRFNPRTPCGVRRCCTSKKRKFTRFQSTHSLRSATDDIVDFDQVLTVSIHALLAECDREGCRCPGVRPVSIHALLAECDSKNAVNADPRSGFNPRTPCGVRLWVNPGRFSNAWFQSTHSLRSATAPDHIHCYSTAQTILCANLPKKAIIT